MPAACAELLPAPAARLAPDRTSGAFERAATNADSER